MTIWLAWAMAEAAAAAPPAAPPPEEIAPGVALIRGAMLPGRGPDGNTVVFDAPEGLIVVDTGRHEKARNAALRYAEYYTGMLREHGGRSADCLER
ncbi:MAG: hypothetical protein ACRETY_03000 [Steroidobacteraceae bacterium]